VGMNNNNISSSSVFLKVEASGFTLFVLSCAINHSVEIKKYDQESKYERREDKDRTVHCLLLACCEGDKQIDGEITHF